jgi:glycosyltransferase involved in cell wall biosynthesis
VGGVPARTTEIINYLGDAFRHAIVALDGNYACGDRLADAAQVDFPSLENGTKQIVGSFLSSHAMLRRLRPDLLLTHNWGTIEWALANTISPVCRHMHLEDGFGLEEADGQLTRRVLFRRIALARTAGVIVPSETLVRLAAQTWKLPPRKVIHIPNGVDCSRFARVPAAGAKLGLQRSADELIVGTVAPLRPEKNLGFLLETFAAIAVRFDAKLVIVGDGSERPKLAQLAKMLDIADRVHFTGHVEAVETVLTYFDVFALTSRTEQMPFSVLQAMAAGKPIAAVDVGDVRRMLSPENRAIVTPKDDLPAFRDSLARLLEDSAARKHLGARNRSHVHEHYPRERMLEAYRKLFEAVTQGRETRDRKTTLPAGRPDQESHNFSDV